jgi:DNA-binding NarL/FixJ family response regulator
MSTKMTTISVLIADDQTLFREGVARLLDGRQGIKVVASAENGERAVELARQLRPDVVLMDIAMPKVDGIAATRAIKAVLPGTRIVILTIHDSDQYLLLGLQAGANGYILKDATHEELVRAIQAVHAGDSLLGQAVAQRLIGVFRRLGASGPEQPPNDGLTERETEVLKHIAAGRSSKQIAMQLDVSDKTIRNHVSNIYQKLHIHDRAQVVLYAVRTGLVEI